MTLACASCVWKCVCLCVFRACLCLGKWYVVPCKRERAVLAMRACAHCPAMAAMAAAILSATRAEAAWKLCSSVLAECRPWTTMVK